MADKDEARAGPSRKDKGKAKVGEPPDYDSGDDQTVQKNEPGPDSGDDSYSPLGPLMCFCLSKTLAPCEVRQKDPVLYLDAYEASVLLNSPEIITSPNANSFQKILYIFDFQYLEYRMLLTKCNRPGWTGYSVADGWDKFAKRHNLVSGDEISFHRSRKHNKFYHHYIYVITKKSDKLEVFTRFEAKDYIMNIPRGPGSRSMPAVALCLLKYLTSAEVDEQHPRIILTADEAFLLTSRAEILDEKSESFSEDLVVFDSLDNRYCMNISNKETGSPKSFLFNTGWETYVRNSNLREGDQLNIYRFLDHKLVPGRFYYALRYFRDPTLYPSVADTVKGNSVLSRTLISENVGPRHPTLNINAPEAYRLTESTEILDPSSEPMELMVYDESDQEYKMLLSRCSVDRYSITKGWGSFCRDNRLRVGDQIFFYRSSTDEEGVEPFYDIRYIRKKEPTMKQQVRPLEERRESPDPKRKPSPGSRGISDTAIKLRNTLSAHQGNIPKLCLSASDAWLLTGCPRIMDKCPPRTILMSFLVYDEGDRSYDMVLTHLACDDEEVICTLDGGWQRFVEFHGLKAGDNVTIYRNQGDNCYALRYDRMSLPSGGSGGGASGEGPSGSGQREA